MLLTENATTTEVEPGSPVGPPATLTVLSCMKGTAYKTWVVGDNGKPEKEPCQPGAFFKFTRRRVQNIHELLRLLQGISESHCDFTIPGAPTPEAVARLRAAKINYDEPGEPDVSSFVRRITKPGCARGSDVVDPAMFQDQAQPILILDLDKLPLPDGLDERRDVRAVLDHIEGQLPPELRNVTHLAHLSSSAGMLPRLASLRLVFLTTEPHSCADLKAWAAGCPLEIDDSIFRPVQPIYWAHPQFGDWLTELSSGPRIADPFPAERLFLRQRSRPRAALVIPAHEGGRDGGSGVTYRGDGSDLPSGWLNKLKLMGDGDGLHRFNAPLVAAAASYMRELGPDADPDAFKAKAREMIEAAPKGPGRAEAVARYKGDAYLNEALHSARRFAPTYAQWAARLACAEGELQADALAAEVAGYRYWSDLDKDAAGKAIAKRTGAAVGLVRDRLTKSREVAAADAITPLAQRLVYCVETKEFVDEETGDILDKEQLNDLHPDPGGRYTPTLVLKSSACRKALFMTYRPGRPFFLKEERNGVLRDAVNRWRPSSLDVSGGPVGDDEVRPWLEHWAKLVPDPAERGHVLSWQAHRLRYPDRKINHGVLLIGTQQGTGKDTAFAPLIAGLGADNVKVIGSSDVAAQWTDWYAGCSLVVIQELLQPHKKDIGNDLKQALASPPERLRVNEKNKRQYTTPNRFGVIAMSNYRHAAYLEDTDRRWCVLDSPMKKEPPSYYRALHGWYADGGLALVCRWLLHRDLSAFDPHENPPMTAGKRAMIEASVDHATDVIRRHLEERTGFARHRLVTLGEVVDALTVGDRAPLRGQKITTTRVGESLRRLGCVELGRTKVGQRYRSKVEVWGLRSPRWLDKVRRAQRLGELYRRERERADRAAGF